MKAQTPLPSDKSLHTMVERQDKIGVATSWRASIREEAEGG